jgi:hypothetical protein
MSAEHERVGEMVPSSEDQITVLRENNRLLMEQLHASQQAMQGLQAQNHRLMTQLGEEIAESDELVKQRDDLTQQLADQRATREWRGPGDVTFAAQPRAELHAENEARQSEA